MLYVLSAHAQNRIRERGIDEEWIGQTLNSPEKTGIDPRDSAVQVAWRKIPENGNRVLKVCYKPSRNYLVVITAFFDRSMRGKL